MVELDGSRGGTHKGDRGQMMDHSIINIFRGAGFGDYFLLIHRSKSACI